LEAYCFFNQSE